MITPESIDRVREAADILEIVGEHVKLKRSGSDYRGPCPFHGGKNPNFSVSPKRNAYYCFKCHASGDSIGFVREHLGMDFVEAVRYVAARAGVEVQESRAQREPGEKDPREPLWECMAAAAEIFREALWEGAEAQAARAYLASRELSREQADRFALGYAPRDGAWIERLRALGHDDARLLEVGLLVAREDGSPPRPRFRGRLMFPILDQSGRTIAFGGRVLGEGEPKYLNSPQGTLFDKGRSLYGLSWAKHPIRKQERVLVVEGYFDAIRLALAGIEEAVAPLGTALTESQAGLLAKLTKSVFLLYDSDDAGLKATFRAGLELLRLGISARVVTLPDGEDPDTYVRAQGPDRMEHALAQGVDILDRQIQLLERRGWFAELHKKRRAIDKLLPTLRATADPVTRELYVARLAEVSGVDRATILREVEQEERRPAARVAEPPPAGAPEGRRDGRWRHEPQAPSMRPADSHNGVIFVEPPRQDDDRFQRRWDSDRRRRKGRREEDWKSSFAVPRVSPSAAVANAEMLLTRAMLQQRTLVEVVAEKWPPESFTRTDLRLLFERLVEEPEVPLDVLTDAMPETLVRDVDAAMEIPDPDPEGTVAGTLGTLQSLALDEENDRLFAMLQATADEAEKDRLLQQIAAVKRERVALKPVLRRVGPRLRS
ncbi:DNA primase [Roseisolibacter sp. H3M3-2]|uniref:DNA primase n=1 Tax=Roseisolibacter sp. H3M3-2 TaxID=3031323 RepID=UPI0023DC3382|nr:DNA primase [Roseisolibacter sp. H3M3-2]MDF1502195.1 DNA primase [Roseisolibacter sp. H3M3-2]